MQNDTIVKRKEKETSCMRMSEEHTNPVFFAMREEPK